VQPHTANNTQKTANLMLGDFTWRESDL
jgi:hypothetical protein